MLRYTQSGWPLNVSPEMKPYWAQREALTVEQNVLMWGIRVIVLKNLQNQVVQELHGSHPGIARMKLIVCMVALFRSSVGEACQETKNTPPKSPYTHGSGQASHDHESISTLQDHFLIDFF